MKTSTTADICKRWSDIDFELAESNIKKLQKRIVKAFCNDDIDLMNHLQHKLIHSYYAKALAVQHVMSCDGYNTAGIDNVTWNDLSDCFNAISLLNHRGYKPLPVKRIYIDKSDGRKRPLGIPTMKDRAMQTLYKLALEPIAEITADEHSYAYRTGRGCRDAISHVVSLLYERTDYQYVLKLDIKSCFDNISHKWLLDNIPFDKKMLDAFLKCGYVEDGIYHDTIEGIPQGGCLSNVLCNMTLDGLESIVIDKCCSDVGFVRYADDCLIFADNAYLFRQEVIPVITEFLAQRGLSLSKEKTTCYSLDESVTYLGYTFCRKDETVILCPSKDNVNRYYCNLRDILLCEQGTSAYNIYNKINPIIRGWFNYYIGVVSDYTMFAHENNTIFMCSDITGIHSIAEILNKKIFNKIYNPKTKKNRDSPF